MDFKPRQQDRLYVALKGKGVSYLPLCEIINGYFIQRENDGIVVAPNPAKSFSKIRSDQGKIPMSVSISRVEMDKIIKTSLAEWGEVTDYLILKAGDELTDELLGFLAKHHNVAHSKD